MFFLLFGIMKISIIGSGLVGSQIALFLLLQNVVEKIFLFDKNYDKALGESMDINQCMSVLNNEKECITSEDISLINNSDVVVVVIGRRRKIGEIRTDLFLPNKNDIQKTCENIKKYSPNAIIVMVTNPSDDFSKMAHELTSCKVFSVGTDLDTARLRELIHSKTSKPRKEITAYVSGEHGENMKIHGVEGKIIEECSQIAINTISKKGATVFAPAMSTVNKIKEIIEQNK